MSSLYDFCSCKSGKKIKFCCYLMTKKAFIAEHGYLLADLPIHKCVVGGKFQEVGKTQLLISRALPHGQFILGLYLIDLWFLGVKDVTFLGEIDERKILELCTAIKDEIHGVDFLYEDARSLALGSVQFAQKLDVKPHPDWQYAKWLLEPERAFDHKFEFGKDGVPYYVSPELERVLAENGF